MQITDERSQPSRLPEKFTRLGRAAGLIEKETLNNRIPDDEGRIKEFYLFYFLKEQSEASGS